MGVKVTFPPAVIRFPYLESGGQGWWGTGGGCSRRPNEGTEGG